MQKKQKKEIWHDIVQGRLIFPLYSQKVYNPSESILSPNRLHTYPAIVCYAEAAIKNNNKAHKIAFITVYWYSLFYV